MNISRTFIYESTGMEHDLESQSVTVKNPGREMNIQFESEEDLKKFIDVLMELQEEIAWSQLHNR